ncbi:hypothetical protein V8C43DRAFT_292004 [Trichoderma afarasin]
MILALLPRSSRSWIRFQCNSHFTSYKLPLDRPQTQHTSLWWHHVVVTMGLDEFAPSWCQPFASAKYNGSFFKVFDPPVQKAFIFAEHLEKESFEAHSCGNGRFVQGAPNPDLEICFEFYKTRSSSKIRVYEDNLVRWLRAIPSLRDDLVDNYLGTFINMDRLLPRYPEMSVKFDQDRREGRNFEALELFVRHFLREGSVFATFGFEYLLKKGILTEIHLHDIQSQNRSMSEDLNLLDAAIGEIEELDIKSSHPFLFMNESPRFQLQAAIKERDPIAVDKVLAMGLVFVDTKTLCLAMRYYEKTVFRHLLKHGARVGGDDIISKLLYRAAKVGLMDAVQLLLTYNANKETRYSSISATALNGAVSGGHLEIVQYLIEKKGASIHGNKYVNPLARAIKYRHTHIIDYLLDAGASVLEDKYLVLLPKFVKTKQVKLDDILGRFTARMGNDARDRLFSTAVSGGHLEIVRSLVAAGVNVNPDTRHCNGFKGFGLCNKEHSSPLAVAASKGYLGIVHCLVAAGANVNPHTCYKENSTTETSRCIRPHYSPLEAATRSNRSEVAQFLSSSGASPLKCEGKGRRLGDLCLCPLSLFTSVNKDCDRVEHSEAIDVDDYPAVPVMPAWERRTMARGLIAKVANSCEKLLDASTTKDASAKFIAFVDQVGTRESVWRSGTRAIRDICEGYMPRSPSDIVNALQVADAMRSVMPPSSLKYSKKEFIDDIPRWASLLSPDDQPLFFEIASYLWGIPASTVGQDMTDSFTRSLMSLQYIVKHLVRTSGLSDYGPGNSYRLQTLRQQYLFDMHPTLTCEGRLTLAEWDPLAKQAVQGNTSTNAPKPPDPEAEESSILARITVLMAGAIFGAILLYLCLSRYGFSTLCLPILASDGDQSWAASDQIITRNSAILARYVGLTSPVDFESWRGTDHLLPKPSPLSLVLPDNLPMEGVRGHMAVVQPSYDGDYPMIDSSSVVDTIMDCSPNVSSHLTASSPATTISTSSMTTTTPDLTAMSTSMDGMIGCEHCDSKFKLGKNGRRGQASNLQKHMKIHHPETIANYRRVIYNCRYGCGTRDPNKSNIKAHENKHCANRKGKQPRCHGKWRQTIT